MSLPPRDLRPLEPGSASPHKLFSTTDVALATFLGSILAGSTLLCINYVRLGRGRAALTSLLCGAAATAALVWAAFALGEHLPLGSGLAIGCVFAMQAIAGALQGDALSTHEAAGGRVGAAWTSAGIGVVSLAVVGGAALAYVLFGVPGAARLGDSVEIGKMTIYYKDGVTEAEARETGAFFRSQGLDGKAMDVQLRREGGKPHILFIAEKSAAAADAFRQIGRAIALYSFGGAPAMVDIADQNLDIHTSLPVDPR